MLGSSPPAGFTLGGPNPLTAVLPRIELPTRITLDPQSTAMTADPRNVAAVLDQQTTEVIIDG